MCVNCGWEDLLNEINEMESNDRFRFSAPTLEGIGETVSGMSHCTERQKEAIENIKNSVDR